MIWSSSDVTGNRRFWPFRIAGAIDIAAIVADRDQLWAEAMALYRQGVQWWLVPNIETIAAEQQAGFVEADIWEDLIDALAEGPSRSLHPGAAVRTGLGDHPVPGGQRGNQGGANARRALPHQARLAQAAEDDRG